MTYEYNSRIHLAEVVLNVKDLASQTTFYHQVIGLDLLFQKEDQAILGVGGKALVHLIQTEQMTSVKDSYGLYHLAILLPSQEDLANIFKHIAELGIPLIGGADHGYSEALYLEDLEGNGIELYRDKPVSEWDIREDGRIIGVTEELDAQNIYELGRKLEPFVIAPKPGWDTFICLLRIAALLQNFIKKCLACRINLLCHQLVGSHRELITTI